MKIAKYGQIELNVDKHLADTLIMNLRKFSSLNVLAKVTPSFPVTSGLKLTGSDFHGVFKMWNFLLINLPQKVFAYLLPFFLENCKKSIPGRKIDLSQSHLAQFLAE